MGGLCTLLFSSFDGAFYVGLLIGVVAELTLPILDIFGRRRRKVFVTAPAMLEVGRGVARST